MKLLRKLCRKLRKALDASSLESVVFAHWLPPDGSLAQFQVGAHRCFYCLAHEFEEEFDRPCPRKRPGTVELA